MDRIIAQMQKNMVSVGCELVLVASAENVFYLSDMDMIPCCVNPVLYAVQPLSPTVVAVPATGKRVIFTASALKQYLDDKKVDGDIFYYPSALFLRFDEGILAPDIYAPSLEDCIRRYLSDCGFNCEGILTDEAFNTLNERKRMIPQSLSSADKLLQQCKLQKTPEEIRRLRIASRVSYEAMDYVKNRLAEGGPIREDDLFYGMRDVIYNQRCQWNYTSLSAGPYSPDIYHQPCEYWLQEGDVVRMDVGAVYRGYGSDVARCYYYGTPKIQDERLYNVLCAAQQRMVEAVHPGLDLAELFYIGDSYIKSHGYQEYHRAGLGHSVGVNTEEQPFISPESVGIVMEPNMVFSIETPYYIKDKAGFNVEDIVLVTEKGHEILI